MTTDENLTQALKEKLSDLQIDDLPFFQAAYYAKYLKQYNCLRDVLEWRANETVPDYVKEFI